MAHKIYITEGIILKKKDYGEADRLFWIYTEKFGMIMAAAKGARLEKSKLRYGLDLYTYGEFAVISLGDFWQITDARDIARALPFNSQALERFSGLAALLVRMIKGEEKNETAWKHLKDFFLEIFKKEKTPDSKNMKDLETRAASGILHSLGYMETMPGNGLAAVSAINRAIKESML
ncbi:MAG: DNA repair protein RecO [Candidatus Pacebacteria bacterium]|nr:DNA repair protein RecO [Candidatus Paceibacterota bacterium]NUQ57008.1 DNA repair protein RecO [Candidatus Paceibacter sp.]